MQLIQTSTLLGLHMAVAVLAPLEQLNCRLQSRTETVAGMTECGAGETRSFSATY